MGVIFIFHCCGFSGKPDLVSAGTEKGGKQGTEELGGKMAADRLVCARLPRLCDGFLCDGGGPGIGPLGGGYMVYRLCGAAVVCRNLFYGFLRL